MPLCHAEVEQATEDDLVELMEIEKRNLGQYVPFGIFVRCGQHSSIRPSRLVEISKCMPCMISC
ncbi:unnamed protein product [Musa acuminata subsp. malaccensis]|uniref:(wild Malaysian banana) hypothetical protein n=1 Tax=Musa acuminata subsp. malaccensis TaxID=214687 RepID=A0A8D7A882_MUSAM|nr:unnamed protein product [Musa acuminata subsp. malaccensis]